MKWKTEWDKGNSHDIVSSSGFTNSRVHYFPPFSDLQALQMKLGWPDFQS